MTKHSGGATINQDGASSSAQEELDGEFAGVAGDAAEKGEKPSPGHRDRGETSSADGASAIDVDCARDRAS
jgi:hypothetical protein